MGLRLVPLDDEPGMRTRSKFCSRQCLHPVGTTDAKLRESDSRPALKAGDTVSLMTVLFGIKSSTL